MEDPRPGGGAAPPADRDPDPLVGELQRERRDRRVLVVAAAIGIVAAVIVGVAFVVGVIGDAAYRTGGVRHGREILACVLGPPLASAAIGYAIVARRRRRR